MLDWNAPADRLLRPPRRDGEDASGSSAGSPARRWRRWRHERAPADGARGQLPEEEAAIRAAVRAPDLAALGAGRAVAVDADAEALLALLADPAVSDPIYDLPRPINASTVRDWIAASDAERERGEGLLPGHPRRRRASWSAIRSSRSGRSAVPASSPSRTRADRQGQGQGSTGAFRAFGWMFETLGVRLIGLTAALDNVRSARLIDAAGFTRMGERGSVRADGSVRPSLYWEMTREAWRRR